MAWAALLSIHKYIDFDFSNVPQGNLAKVFQKQYFTIPQKPTNWLDKWIYVPFNQFKELSLSFSVQIEQNTSL